MNEEEMKTKWCPFVRQVAVDKNNRVLNVVAFNKCVSEEGRVFKPTGSNCIGSQCAAWIWSKDQPKTGNSNDIQGYCGLIRG